MPAGGHEGSCACWGLAASHAELLYTLGADWMRVLELDGRVHSSVRSSDAAVNGAGLQFGC